MFLKSAKLLKYKPQMLKSVGFSTYIWGLPQTVLIKTFFIL